MMTSEGSPAPTGRHLPREYLDEAQVLLAYAAQRGLAVDRTVVATLVNAAHQAEAQTWDSELETEFWLAFNQLARDVAPVTVDSLRATTSYHKDLSAQAPGSLGKRIGSAIGAFVLGSFDDLPAKRTVGMYQRGALLIMLLLLMTHAYWLIGSTIVNDIQILPPKITALESDKRALENAAGNQAAGDYEINSLDAGIEELQNRITAGYAMLQSWNQLWSAVWPSPPEANLPRLDDPLDKLNLDRMIELQLAIFAIQVIQLYVLPLLYGLLGAAAYVLRVLTIEIRTLAYAAHSNIGYRLRLQLGAVSGLAIGWFAEGGEATTMGSLSPLALAFLAGYSVEVLFSLMDRLIYTFSTGSEGRFVTPTPKN